MVKPQRQGHFYLITGLVIGLLIGIFYGWVINPTRYIDITPQSLHVDFQKQYILLIAQSYQVNEDIGRSYSRILQISDPVDMDSLRTLLLEMESDPEYAPYFDTMRTLINDLERYIQGVPISNNAGTGTDQEFVSATPIVEDADTNQPVPEQQGNNDPGFQQPEGFFVVSNP